MTSRDFVFWLQGYFEILDPSLEAAPFPLGPAQVKSIRDHLQLVFTHDINPPPPTPPPAAVTPRTWHEHLQSSGGHDLVAIC
jgi:hypothetical protein